MDGSFGGGAPRIRRRREFLASLRTDMLFDLQGKRRRVVQATYLTLAVLMGGGLVLFGIGGEVQGGLFDAFSGNGGGGGNDIVEERAERNEERIQKRPRDVELRKELVRDYYSLAFAQYEQGATSPPEDAKDELQRASTHWNAYLELAKKPDSDVARVALQVYDPVALNDPDSALRAARIIAEQDKAWPSYIQLVQYAVLAGDKKTQKSAKDKALALAKTPGERKAVQDQLKQIAQAQIAQQVQAGNIKLDGSPQKDGKNAGKQAGGK
jgi:hypothetical protein